MSERIFLPALLFDMKEAFGLPKALEFAQEFGGRTIYLSVSADPDHDVAKLFGVPLLEWLIAWHRGGGALVVPLGPMSSHNRRIRLIRKLLQDGADTTTIIRAAECHERTIRRHRATLRDGKPADPRQGRLKL